MWAWVWICIVNCLFFRFSLFHVIECLGHVCTVMCSDLWIPTMLCVECISIMLCGCFVTWPVLQCSEIFSANFFVVRVCLSSSGCCCSLCCMWVFTHICLLCSLNLIAPWSSPVWNVLPGNQYCNCTFSPCEIELIRIMCQTLYTSLAVPFYSRLCINFHCFSGLILLHLFRCLVQHCRIIYFLIRLYRLPM